MALLPHEIDDLVNLTFNRERKHEWTDISLDNQFHVFNEMFMKGNEMTPVKGGPRQRWTLQTDNTNTFQWTGLYHEDRTQVKNVTIKGQQEWAIATANMTYDVGEEEFQGDDVTMIVRELLIRENAMYNEWFEGMESAFWQSPSSSTLENMPMSGIPHWVVKNATEGFNGGNPTGWASGAGNIDSATYTRWRNYSGTYSAVSRADLISKWLKMCEFTRFRSPHQFPDGSKAGEMPDAAHFTTYVLYESLQRFLDSRNDNLRDLAGLAGDLVFKGRPLYWVPELTNSGQPGYDSTNPLYSINKNSMEFFFQEGNEMVRSEPRQRDGQSRVRTIYMHSFLNTLCRNRRLNGVLYQA